RGGWRVIATLRNARARAELFKEELASGQFHLHELDVTKDEDRQAAAKLIETQFGGRLDCLVNNAGYGVFGALEDVSEQQLREQMEVNFFGLALTTRALLPALRQARGRVINVSSVLGFIGMPMTSLYCSSKFAVDGLSESLRFELEPHGVQVTVVQPGSFRTSFTQNQQYGERTFDESSPYFEWSKALKRYRERRAAGAGTPPDEVIRKIIKLANSEHTPLRIRCGKDARGVYAMKRLLPERLQWSVMAMAFRRMFDTSGQK
ncbi:MAG TPA: SDR family oxidoreductase, partial [Blastocatellia bacterium]|nr:SDR family oxidoreductase [Blastocatellia bacterium]